MTPTDWRPTNASAACAGVWSALGSLAFLAWGAQPGSSIHRGQTGAIAGLVAGTVFILLPVLLFVIGRDPGGARWSLLREQAERSRFLATIGRAFIWFASTAVVGIIFWFTLDGLGIKQFKFI